MHNKPQCKLQHMALRKLLVAYDVFCVALHFVQTIFADRLLPQKNHSIYPKPYDGDIRKVIKVDIINEHFATLLEEDSVISWLP